MNDISNCFGNEIIIKMKKTEHLLSKIELIFFHFF